MPQLLVLTSKSWTQSDCLETYNTKQQGLTVNNEERKHLTTRIRFGSYGGRVTFEEVYPDEVENPKRPFVEVAVSTVEMWRHIDNLAYEANEQRNMLWQQALEKDDEA